MLAKVEQVFAYERGHDIWLEEAAHVFIFHGFRHGPTVWPKGRLAPGKVQQWFTIGLSVFYLHVDAPPLAVPCRGTLLQATSWGVACWNFARFIAQLFSRSSCREWNTSEKKGLGRHMGNGGRGQRERRTDRQRDSEMHNLHNHTGR